MEQNTSTQTPAEATPQSPASEQKGTAYIAKMSEQLRGEEVKSSLAVLNAKQKARRG